MDIKLKPEIKKKTGIFLLLTTVFMGGFMTPDIAKNIQAPKTSTTTEVKEAPKVHTKHTAVLGVPLLESFEYRDPMYEYYNRSSGAHLQYPLKFTCGCNDKKQFGLADISLVDLEGKTYEVRHTPISDDHNNLWFLTAEVKTETAPTAAPPETNGN